MKIKNIFLLGVLGLLLTGCTNKIQELKKSVTSEETKPKITEEETVVSSPGEQTGATVNDVEKDLQSLDDLNVDQELGELEKEL